MNDKNVRSTPLQD